MEIDSTERYRGSKVRPSTERIGETERRQRVRNVLIRLHCLSTVVMVFVLTRLEIDAATRTVFKSRVPETQLLDWLKKRNHDAEDLGNSRYRIYYHDYENATENDPKDDYGHYTIATFDWGPPGGLADVFVSSKVELVPPKNHMTPDTGLPEYRYHYQITSLETSRQSIHSVKVRTPDHPRNWQRDILNPPGWKNYGQPYKFEHSNNGVTWSTNSGMSNITPGVSQDGFVFQSRSVPGIIMVDIWTSGNDISSLEGIATPYHHQYAPRGLAIGPVAIPFVEALNTLEKQSQTISKQIGKTGTPSTEVEKQNPAEPPIIVEALTLLKTNAVYLLTKL